MASFATLLDQSVQKALTPLEAEKGGAYVTPTDQQLITAIGTLIYNELNMQSVS